MLFLLVSFSHTGWLLLFALIVGISTSCSACGHSSSWSSDGCSGHCSCGAGKCTSKCLKNSLTYSFCLSSHHQWVGSVGGGVALALQTQVACCCLFYFSPCPHPLSFVPFSHTQVDCWLLLFAVDSWSFPLLWCLQLQWEAVAAGQRSLCQ